MNENIRISDVLTEEYDVFVGFVSFEKRSFSLSNKLDVNKLSKVYVIRNEKTVENKHIVENAVEFEKKFGSKMEYIDVNFDRPLLSADNLKSYFNFLKSKEEKIKILLDISTFTHEMLLMFLCILRSWTNNVELTCVYTNTLDYSAQETVENKWLSRGLRDVRTVLGFPGDNLPSQKTHLVLIVGYEYERAYNIINVIEPNSLSLGYVEAEETSTEKNKDANSHYLRLIEEMAISYDDIERFTISCRNVEKTVKELNKIIELHKGENIVIVPLNNKVSTIAVAVTVFNNPEVQICYGQPVLYNEESYSVPGNDFFCYRFEDNDWGNI